MSFVSNFRRWVYREGCPLTIGVMVCVVATTVFLFFAPQYMLKLMLTPESSPLTAFSYWLSGHPVDGFGLIFFVLMLMWWMNMGGSVERELGRDKFAAYLAISILLPALMFLIAFKGLHQNAFLGSMLLPLSMMTVAYCTRHATEPMCFWGISVPAKVIGWFMAIIVFTDYGFKQPLMGVLAVAPLAFAWAFAANRIPGFGYTRNATKPKQSKAARIKEEAYFTNVKDREKERQEREKLRKLFEDSIDK